MGALADPLIHKVKTPTLFLHGENDNDVPIAEAEQFFIALHDVGVETVLVRYPREGHGLRETTHVVDRSSAVSPGTASTSRRRNLANRVRGSGPR